jgi:hypothetical protein
MLSESEGPRVPAGRKVPGIEVNLIWLEDCKSVKVEVQHIIDQHGPGFKMRNIGPEDYPEVTQAATTVGKYPHDHGGETRVGQPPAANINILLLRKALMCINHRWQQRVRSRNKPSIVEGNGQQIWGNGGGNKWPIAEDALTTDLISERSQTKKQECDINTALSQLFCDGR